jgi:protein gp37
MKDTKIAWTGNTWNPIWGCSAVSAGCTHCYAASMAGRFGGPGQKYEGLVQISPKTGKSTNKWTGEIRLAEEHLSDPLHWRQPTLIFVDSMSDLFHEKVPVEYIRRVCDIMLRANWHTYQVLTKRHERMKELLSAPEFADVSQAAHIWWGVSAEDHRWGVPRIEALQHTPVRNRFVSVEPCLEDISDVDLSGIHWVIQGGESSGGREFRVEWARAMRDRCRELGIPYLLKQLGQRPTEDRRRILAQTRPDTGRRDIKHEYMPHWPADLQVQQWPEAMTEHPRHASIAPALVAEHQSPPSTLPLPEIKKTLQWLAPYTSRHDDNLRAGLAASAITCMQALVESLIGKGRAA